MNAPNRKATRTVAALRVEDVLRIRLDGAEFHDVREYANEHALKTGSPWELSGDAKPLSDSTLWRYIGKADELIRQCLLSSRKKRFRMHLAQRRNLYAKAINSGDLRAALAALDSLAKLEGLYPSADAATQIEIGRLEERLRALLAAAAPVTEESP